MEGNSRMEDSSSKSRQSSESPLDSQKLDELLVDYLESMEVYVRTTLDEENLLREGFINIAHARMCVKPQLISLQGFPNDLTPEFQPSATTSTSIIVDKDESDLEIDDPPSTSLLHRELNVDISKEKDNQLRKVFGQVTPASLKKAQSTFHLVLERSIERANIMNRLNYLERKILEITSTSSTTSKTKTSHQSQSQSQSQNSSPNSNSNSPLLTSSSTVNTKSSAPTTTTQLKSKDQETENDEKSENENEKENSEILKIDKLTIAS